MADHTSKLTEAAFFLKLLEALELRNESMTHENSREVEASFLFSAVLNAFYSALHQWKKNAGNHAAYEAFKKEHPEIHASSQQHGWRNLTVHEAHVPISGVRTVPTFGLEAAYRVQASKLAQNEDTLFAPIQVHLTQFCVEYRGQSKPLLEFCSQHLAALKQLFG